MAETGARTSFFDDDDLNIRFEFVKPEKTHFKYLTTQPIVKGPLTRHSSNLEPSDKGLYALHTRVLAYYESPTSKVAQFVLDLAHSRIYLSLTPSDDQNYSFSVSRNGNTYKFFSADKKTIENWATALRQVCVLTNFHEEYKALKMIGKGSFAKVYLVESKITKKHFAVKAFTKEGAIISNKNNAKPAMVNEIDIMRALDHENVIKLYEVFETEKSIYLVLELIQGRSLQEMLKKQVFKEEAYESKIAMITRQIFEGLTHLAARGVMHRDLKPDNILLDKNDRIKIVDFGLSTFIDVPEYIFKKCGTPGYIAPEVFKYDQKVATTAYDGHCDVFSIGCIMYYMYLGSPFFEGSNASEILKVNRRFTVDHDPIANIRRELKDSTSKIPKEGLNLLLQLIEFDQKKRLSANQVLTHPYYTPTLGGSQRIPGFHQTYTDGFRSGSLSPHGLGALKRTSSNSPDKVSPFHRERYLDKDSMHLDVGRQEITGRIDTLTNGSTQNSLSFANKIAELASTNSAASSNNSMSPFGRGSLADYKKYGARSFGKNNSIGGNQSYMKSSIHKSGTKGEEDYKEDMSPMFKLEMMKNEKKHRHSEQIPPNAEFLANDRLRPGSKSPTTTYYKTESATVSESPFQLKLEQVQPNSANPLNINKPSQISSRKFQNYPQKN